MKSPAQTQKEAKGKVTPAKSAPATTTTSVTRSASRRVSPKLTPTEKTKSRQSSSSRSRSPAMKKPAERAASKPRAEVAGESVAEAAKESAPPKINESVVSLDASANTGQGDVEDEAKRKIQEIEAALRSLSDASEGEEALSGEEVEQEDKPMFENLFEKKASQDSPKVESSWKDVVTLSASPSSCGSALDRSPLAAAERSPMAMATAEEASPEPVPMQVDSVPDEALVIDEAQEDEEMPEHESQPAQRLDVESLNDGELEPGNEEDKAGEETSAPFQVPPEELLQLSEERMASALKSSFAHGTGAVKQESASDFDAHDGRSFQASAEGADFECYDLRPAGFGKPEEPSSCMQQQTQSLKHDTASHFPTLKTDAPHRYYDCKFQQQQQQMGISNASSGTTIFMDAKDHGNAESLMIPCGASRTQGLLTVRRDSQTPSEGESRASQAFVSSNTAPFHEEESMTSSSASSVSYPGSPQAGRHLVFCLACCLALPFALLCWRDPLASARRAQLLRIIARCCIITGLAQQQARALGASPRVLVHICKRLARE